MDYTVNLFGFGIIIGPIAMGLAFLAIAHAELALKVKKLEALLTPRATLSGNLKDGVMK